MISYITTQGDHKTSWHGEPTGDAHVPQPIRQINSVGHLCTGLATGSLRFSGIQQHASWRKFAVADVSSTYQVASSRDNRKHFVVTKLFPFHCVLSSDIIVCVVDRKFPSKFSIYFDTRLLCGVCGISKNKHIVFQRAYSVI